MKEYLSSNSKTLTVAVQGSKVVSLRINQKDSHTVRVYKDGYIGIAGMLGDCDMAELEKKATENLALKIAYPEVITPAVVKEVSRKENIIKEEDLVKITEHLLERLTEACPNFIFSNKVELKNVMDTYENDCGSKLKFESNKLYVQLQIKDKDSANIMDTWLGVGIRDYNEDSIVEEARLLHENYYKLVDIEPGEYPIITGIDILGQAFQHIEGRMYAMGASLFSGKLGQKIFNEKLSIVADYNDYSANTSFFDAEGYFPEDGKFYFIKNGVLTGLLSNKKYNKEFNLPLSGCADAGYDSVPSPSVRYIDSDITANDIKDIVKGKALLISMTSGGDYTPTGDYSTPVMVGYLVEDGKIVGRVNGTFNISGNIYDFLGKNYMGTIRDFVSLAPNEYKDRYLVTKMSVTK